MNDSGFTDAGDQMGYKYDQVGNLIEKGNMEADAEISYYHYDNLGSTMMMTDKNGAEVFRQDYAPFGQNLYVPGVSAEPLQLEQAGFKFTGQREDAGTGLYYYNARYYDLETGRFTREDEYQGDVFWPQTQNVYVYALNNPIKYIDPTGYANEIGAGGGLGDYEEPEPEVDDGGGFWQKLGLFLGGNGFKNVKELREEGVGWANWEDTLCNNVSDRVSKIDPNLPDGIRQLLIDLIIKDEVQKLQSQYLGLYTASYMPWNKPIKNTLRPLFEEYDLRKKDGNKILQAVGEGFSSGFNFGLWYAALSPEPQKVQSVAGEGAGKAFEGTRKTSADFKNGTKLNQHFLDHADDFGIKIADEYLDAARNFVAKRPTSTTQSFVSEGGTYFRYDTATNEFGIINQYGGISTYFKPSNGMDYWLEQIKLYKP